MLVINMLGDFRVQIDHQPVEISSRPARTLLAYLVLNRAAVHTRERISGLFWPDVLESSARQNLRSAIYSLSKAIGKEYLIVDHASIGFNAAAPHQLDIDRLIAGPGEDLDSLLESVSAYQGELLAGFGEDWVMLERERLRSIYELRILALLDRLAEARRWEEVITWAEHWIAFGYIPEPAYRALMTAHASRGDMAAMASAYRRCIEALQTGLGVRPSEETNLLYQKLSRAGEQQTEPVGRSFSSSALPVSQPIEPSPGLHTFPKSGTSFVGRQKEVAEIRELLLEYDCRLLTLTGLGGSGKTRLSIEAASGMEFPDGVWFLALESIHHSEMLINRLTKLFGVLYGDTDLPEFCLLQFLKDRKLLLVMDNFEHLLPGSNFSSGEQGAISILTKLIEQISGLKLLITSRERLHIHKEWIYPVGGLELEQAGNLFRQRERQVKRGLLPAEEDNEAVQRICEMLGGFPLAIELAAAWTSVLSYEQIAAEIQQGLDILSTRLSNIPARHQKMEVIFDSSWSRLAEQEKQFFRRLAVFQGSFTHQAAEQICISRVRGGNTSGSLSQQALELIASLVEKSFLQTADSGRFKLHELFRQYSQKRLSESDEEERVRDLHARYYLKLLSSYESALKRSEQHLVLDQISQDLDNFLAGWYWAAQRGLLEIMIQPVEALWLFFSMRRYSLELNSIMQQTLSYLEGLAEDIRDKNLLEGLVVALNGGALMLAGSYDTAGKLLAKAMSILSKHEPKRWLALTGNWLASNQQALGNYQEALTLLLRSIEICEQENDQWLLAYCLNDLGMINYLRGESDEARASSLKSINIFQAIDDRRGMAFVYSNLGLYAFNMGKTKQALSYYQESLNLREQNRDQLGQAQVHLRLGAALSAEDDHEIGQQHLMKALRIVYPMQFSGILVETMVELAFILFKQGKEVFARQILSLCFVHPSIRPELITQAKQRYEQCYPQDPLTLLDQFTPAAFDLAVKELLNVAIV
jgi:predicted ATPase/DNA-binding SARP family transcriptional activator